MKVIHRHDMPGVIEVQFANGDRSYGRRRGMALRAIWHRLQRLGLLGSFKAMTHREFEEGEGRNQ